MPTPSPEQCPKQKLGELSIMPKLAVYYRADGTMWGKLNEINQVPVILHEDGRVTGNGVATGLDPEEIVSVLVNHN